jgi:hypothetical protein
VRSPFIFVLVVVTGLELQSERRWRSGCALCAHRPLSSLLRGKSEDATESGHQPPHLRQFQKVCESGHLHLVLASLGVLVRSAGRQTTRALLRGKSENVRKSGHLRIIPWFLKFSRISTRHAAY